MKRLALIAAALPILLGCGSGERPAEPLGSVYEDVSRPEVWKVLPASQAEKVGLVTGDLVLTYNSQPVRTNDEIRNAQAMALGSTEPIPIIVKRRNEEIEFNVQPGPLGVMPVAARYPSSLALAFTDIMTHFGVFTDYDWLAALTGESFTFTAREGDCASSWPGGKAGVYLHEVVRAAGLTLEPVCGPCTLQVAANAIRGELLRGRVVLVEGGWPDHRRDYWGVATGFDAEVGRVVGLTIDAAGELPLVGPVKNAWVVSVADDWAEPEELVRQVLDQALELTQVRADSGWKSGLDAYNLLITRLQSLPFCPVCGPMGSQDCLERLAWTMVANKESANRFLEWMRLAVPDQAAVIDDITGRNSAIIAKLEGLVRSGAKVGQLEDQQKIARQVGDIQMIESELISRYEELIGAL
jgi:hypothetical protein